MPIIPVTPYLVTENWPELDAWCSAYPVNIGVDFADGSMDAYWVQLRHPSAENHPDRIEWYQITPAEAQKLRDNDGRYLSGDVEQMISDIDRNELTPATRCEIFKLYVSRAVTDTFDGMLTLALHGKL